MKSVTNFLARAFFVLAVAAGALWAWLIDTALTRTSPVPPGVLLALFLGPFVAFVVYACTVAERARWADGGVAPAEADAGLVSRGEFWNTHEGFKFLCPHLIPYLAEPLDYPYTLDFHGLPLYHVVSKEALALSSPFPPERPERYFRYTAAPRLEPKS